MDYATRYILQLFNTTRNDSLYVNALFGIASSVTLAVGGFLFWFVGARWYMPVDIGLATAVVAAMTLIVHVSNLGLDAGLVRFLPKSEKKQQLITGVFLTVSVAAFFTASLYLLLLPFLSPHLTFLRESLSTILISLLLLVGLVLSFTIESVFLAFKSVQMTLIKNVVASTLKLLLLFVFIPFGAFGIFLAWTMGVAISLGISFGMLRKKWALKLDVGRTIQPITDMATFSSVNYVIGFLGLLPTFLIPIFITNLLSPEDAAYYYIPMMIANLLYFIPFSITQSLFAEGSHSEEALLLHTTKAVKLTGITLIPSIGITLLLGGYLLSFFGNSYAASGSTLLQILALSGIFVAGNYVFLTICNVKRRLKTLVIVNIIGATTIILLSFFLLRSFSLEGVGFAWMIGQLVMNICYGVSLTPVLFPAIRKRLASVNV